MKSRVREMLLEEDCESFESLSFNIDIHIYETRKIKLKKEIFSKQRTTFSPTRPYKCTYFIRIKIHHPKNKNNFYDLEREIERRNFFPNNNQITNNILILRSSALVRIQHRIQHFSHFHLHN